MQALHRIIEENLSRQWLVQIEWRRDSCSDSNNGHVWRGDRQATAN